MSKENKEEKAKTGEKIEKADKKVTGKVKTEAKKEEKVEETAKQQKKEKEENRDEVKTESIEKEKVEETAKQQEIEIAQEKEKEFKGEEKIEKKEEAKETAEDEPEEKIEEVTETAEITKKSEERRKELESWVPKTKLGRMVKEKKIKNIDEILDKKLKIMEQEIVDSLLNLESELLAIGQAKGKFGGGKRRAWKQTQKKTAEGNVPTFSCMAVVGDKRGYVGLGHGKAKETLPARTKALREAKLNIMKVSRGCGSFDCACGEKHSIPLRIEGKCGSSKVKLIPAPQGTGLVIGDECKKILRLAGIKDIYSKTFGQTRTTINLAKACIDALKNLEKIKFKTKDKK